jgi:acetyl/propionyl-CoA carboxylase alpha subunit
MRRVQDRTELVPALAAGASEAASAFGDGRVYLERELRPARHIEVQLLGDAAGEVIAIGERDCSIQRRHQKLVEEAPAPGLAPGQRAELFELAVRAAKAAGLRNAATAEFLRDEEGRFWFLEVNARLQVEHGVTELVTGLDLVREQFQLAAGRPLSPEAHAAAIAAVAPTRHAIEVRLSAEDPARAFVPAPGTIGRWRMPAGPGIRVDTALTAGARVPPDYDPLIAKVIADAEDRTRAIARLARGLAEIEVTGIQTTLPFHLAIVREPAFVAGELSTDFVVDHWDGPARRAAACPSASWAAARAVAGGRDGDGPSGGSPASVRKDTAPSSAWRASAREDPTDRWPRRSSP